MLDRQSGTDHNLERITQDPNFRTLVRERTGFAWTMSGLMLAVYLGFIFLAAFGKGVMSATIGDSSISWGILLGLGVIVFAFVLTGIYVVRANSRFDELTARIHKDTV
jgi:uncharacterized membrane protein (DUF485 family)